MDDMSVKKTESTIVEIGEVVSSVLKTSGEKEIEDLGLAVH